MNEVQNSSRAKRISELQAEIDAITQVPKANGEFAAKSAVALVACYPSQQSADPAVARIYLRQLTDAMVGQDIDVLRSMLDAKAGLVARQKFLPAISEVVGFIDEKMEPKRSRIGWYLDEIDRIERIEDGHSVPQEMREQQAKRAREVARHIREAAKAVQRFNLPPSQADCREEICAGTIHIPAEQMKPTPEEAAS